MSKGAWLSYKLYYELMEDLSCPDCRYYFVLMTYIICIDHITSYLDRNAIPVLHSFVLVMVVDIICIDQITSYLSHNVHPFLHIYSSSVSNWCINYFPVCNLICFYVQSYLLLVHSMSEYKLNRNSIRIYVPPFFTLIEASFYFLLKLLFVCCIGIFYKCVHGVCMFHF